MAADPCDAPRIVKVAEGFCVRQAVDNIAWADMGGYALVVDALEQAELEDEVFAAIRDTLGGLSVRYVVNTHTHYDHVALNKAFRRRFSAEIVNRRTADIPPEGKWIEGRVRRALILPIPDLHTPDDCVVWIPEDKALFVGDLFGWGLIPLSRQLDDGSAAELLAAYDRMIEFDPRVVIPGHGPVCSGAELRRWVEYFNWLGERVCAAVAGGAGDRQIVRDLPVPGDMRHWWRLVQWKHEDSLRKVLRAVRSGVLSG